VRLTSTMFVTLDGVTQAPGAPDEDRSGGFAHGGWLVPYADNDMGEIIAGRFSRASAFLLGRRTYEIFAGHWPGVPDGNPVAAALNTLPKYVVSTTLTEVSWGNSSLLGGGLVEAVAGLKALPGDELQVHGSGALVKTLLANDLLDEIQLLVYPVVLGAGRRLFDDPGLTAAFRLVGSRTTASGISALTYVPDGKPRYDSFASAPEPAQQRILR
jgi:dihydrofolate reductase